MIDNTTSRDPVNFVQSAVAFHLHLQKTTKSRIKRTMVVGLDPRLRPVVEAMLNDYTTSKGKDRIAVVNSAMEQVTALAEKEGITTPFTHKVSIIHTHLIPSVALNLCCRPLKTGSKTINRKTRARPNPAMSRRNSGMLGMSGVSSRRR
jgi:hypothetical protein